MSRDEFRTQPEGMSVVANQLTVLWMEIGDRAVYQIGRRVGSDTHIYLRCAKTVMSEPVYATGLRLDVAFNRVSRSASSSAERRATQKLDHDVDALLRASRPPPNTRPVTPMLAALTHRPFDFAEITSILAHRNIKRLRVRTWVSLPQFSGELWHLHLGFPNFPDQPRILRPAESDIIPPGL